MNYCVCEGFVKDFASLELFLLLAFTFSIVFSLVRSLSHSLSCLVHFFIFFCCLWLVRVNVLPMHFRIFSCQVRSGILKLTWRIIVNHKIRVHICYEFRDSACACSLCCNYAKYTRVEKVCYTISVHFIHDARIIYWRCMEMYLCGQAVPIHASAFRISWRRFVLQCCFWIVLF